MKQGANQILSIQSDFLREARNAPKLISDLASLEQHIADSYKDRALIELLQNADDAQAGRVCVLEIGDCLVVANDGRHFTADDVKALCRSGASKKSRGGETIGFRGIGFKSVINLAERVSILSGKYAFFFDRCATEALLPDIRLVPLLRIPHLWDNGESDVSKVVTGLAVHKYNTFFLFHQVRSSSAREELLSLHSSSLLFLNNIVEVEIQTTHIDRRIKVKNADDCGRFYKLLEDDQSSEKWEIITKPENQSDKIAFLCDGKQIVPAPPEESVMHSFTPTMEFSGAYVKMNGDFSTDPSRKHIDMDQVSRVSYDNCVDLIFDTIVEALEGAKTRVGLFSLFLGESSRIGDNRYRHLLIGELVSRLNDCELCNFNGRNVAASSIRLRPDWLNYDDYQNLCHHDLTFISSDLLTQYPELPRALKALGYHELFLKEAIDKLNSSKISLTGAAQVLSKLISQYRYDLTQQNVDMLRDLKIWATSSGVISAPKVESFGHLEPRFQQYVCQNTDPKDLRLFLSKLDIHYDESTSIVEKTKEENRDTKEDLSQKSSHDASTQLPAGRTAFQSSVPISKLSPRIPRWRTAEKMVENYLSSMADTLKVTDVSKSNVGYDLEVLFNSGVLWYIEVKSVSSFTDIIKLTNNEYASAHDKGNSYILAVITNKEPVEVRFLRDPVSHISFEKQIERWSWVSDSYGSLLKTIDKLVDD